MPSSRLTSAILACSILLSGWASDGLADTQQTLDEAIQEYRAGHTDRAAQLLTQVLKEGQDNGKAHYYLAQAMKKMGQSQAAAEQLELATKFCPPGVLQALTKEAMDTTASPPSMPGHASNQTKTAVQAAAQTQAKAASGPFAMPDIWGGITSMFSGEKKPSNSGSVQLEKQDDKSFDLMRPDIFAPLKESLQRSKDWMREKLSSAKTSIAGMTSNMQGLVVPMGRLQSEVENSHNSKWQSAPGGVAKFSQAPENSPQWDAWISQFRRSFRIILMRHLYHDAGNEFGGTAQVVFSVDNKGNLRGAIFQSTGDAVLNKALVDTVQALDHSPLLAFPPNSHCTGWNFSTSWDFGRPMAFIHYIRQLQQEKQAAAKAAQVAKMETEAKLKEQHKQKELKAKIAKLKEKKKIASVLVKQNVSGLVLPAAKPLELKATQLKLSDMPPVKNGRIYDGGYVDGGLSVDEFNTVVHGQDSDFSFMKRPELNRTDINAGQTLPPAPSAPSEGQAK